MDKRVPRPLALETWPQGQGEGAQGASLQLTGVTSGSPVNCARAQAGSPST